LDSRYEVVIDTKQCSTLKGAIWKSAFLSRIANEGSLIDRFFAGARLNRRRFPIATYVIDSGIGKNARNRIDPGKPGAIAAIGNARHPQR
jgi:hypothetical protein